VVDAEEMQRGGVEVGDVDGVSEHPAVSAGQVGKA
jgi:hypothetical protein